MLVWAPQLQTYLNMHIRPTNGDIFMKANPIEMTILAFKNTYITERDQKTHNLAENFHRVATFKLRQIVNEEEAKKLISRFE